MLTLRALWTGLVALLPPGRPSGQSDRSAGPEAGRRGPQSGEPAEAAAEPVVRGDVDAELFTSVHDVRISHERSRTAKQPPFLGPEARALIERALAEASGTKDVCDVILPVIEDLDNQLSVLVNPLLHAPEFQRLEAAWRGLHYLVRNTDTGEQLKIRVLNISKDELSHHVGAADWDSNRLFRAVHDETFGTPGGQPYACLVGDFEFSHSPDDLQLLRALSLIAAAMHAPFIAGASARLFGVDDWADVAASQTLLQRLEDADHGDWRKLRDDKESKFLALCLPGLLARVPYGARNDPVDEFACEEDADPLSRRNAVWINAAYGMAVNLNGAQSVHGWCSRFVGIRWDGMIADLPSCSVTGDDGRPVLMAPVEAVLSEKSHMELSKAGLIPVLPYRHSGRAVFVTAQSMFRPRRFEGENAVTATALDILSARLPYWFPVYRFAHYLRVLIRDRTGCFDDAASLSRELQTWLDGYVHVDALHAKATELARRPLASGRIDIVADESCSGRYQVRLSLRPCFQLDGLDLDLPLVWPLPDLVLRAKG